MRIAQFKKWIRPLGLLILAILFLVYSDTRLWILFLLLALFYFAVDVMHIDKADSPDTDLTEEFSSHKLGVLDHYNLDSDLSYGLFVSLLDRKVLVDIREDKFIDQRKRFACYLSDNSDKLEKNLKEFIKSHPEYSSSHVTCIGLYSKALDQGEVSWHPDGYTILKGLEFVS